ncbi:MAG: hypothetical protein ABI882_13720, partial [Acidobacteriota bacterium]
MKVEPEDGNVDQATQRNSSVPLRWTLAVAAGIALIAIAAVIYFPRRAVERIDAAPSAEKPTGTVAFL